VQPKLEAAGKEGRSRSNITCRSNIFNQVTAFKSWVPQIGSSVWYLALISPGAIHLTHSRIATYPPFTYRNLERHTVLELVEGELYPQSRHRHQQYCRGSNRDVRFCSHAIQLITFSGESANGLLGFAQKYRTL